MALTKPKEFNHNITPMIRLRVRFSKWMLNRYESIVFTATNEQELDEMFTNWEEERPFVKIINYTYSEGCSRQYNHGLIKYDKSKSLIIFYKDERKINIRKLIRILKINKGGTLYDPGQQL